jgi:hypothetical protein
MFPWDLELGFWDFVKAPQNAIPIPRSFAAKAFLKHIHINIGRPGRVWRGCEKSTGISGNFWRAFVQEIEESSDRLLGGQKLAKFSNFHSR